MSHVAKIPLPGTGYDVFDRHRAAKPTGLGKEIPTDWFLQDIKP